MRKASDDSGSGGKHSAAHVAVTHYDLSGPDFSIQFSRTDPNELELVYTQRDPFGQRTFKGRAIYRAQTEPGFIATVVLVSAPDLHKVFLSLVLPEANRRANVKSVSVKTFAFRTTSRTSIGGPALVEGQIQVYETVALEGKAW